MNKEQITEFVIAAQAGDRQAFGQLVEAFQQTVIAIAMRRLGNHAEAQELAQEVFIHALRKIHQLKNPICFASWLRSIAGRMAINRAVRRRSVVATEQETLEATCVDRDTPLDQALANERCVQLRAGLSRLRDLDRQTLVAFYIDGDSIQQMSNRFSSPVGTIKRRLHMARKRLAEELSDMAAV
ncbi:MAG: sigma-70 family RNA polymerase sigma factor [Planctomycetales bacterium]